MKPVVARLYGIFVILTLLGLGAWSGADWYRQGQSAQEMGQAALRQIAGQLADRSLHPPTAVTRPLASLFSPLATPESRWKTILLYSTGGGTEYYRGPRPPVPADQAVPRWDPRPLSEVRVSIPVFEASGPPKTLEGIYEFYGRAEIFSLLKACGFTLVILVILTTLMVIFTTQAPGPASNQVPISPEDPPGPDLDLDLGPFPEMETGGDDEYWFDDDLTLEDLPPLETPRAAPPASSAPSLFSPASGLGWEAYLVTRLTFELDRSASQNMDLALVLLGPKDGVVDQETWGNSIRAAFPSADLDFEYQGGAAVILPGQTLEQALRAARSFVDSADRNLSGLVIHAGVAARSGRLVSGETLLGEAESAKRRSQGGSVRVLGLKTDPEKYRQHIASSQA